MSDKMNVDGHNKSEILNKLINFYKLIDGFSGMCPPECDLCEKKETLILLPHEEELMHEHIENKEPNMFFKTSCGYHYQPLGFSCSMLQSSGTCQIYPKRPFDCRSFPVVPRFRLDENDSIEFFLASSYCPILTNLPNNFIKTTIQCWISIAENLSLEWKRMYNNLNQHCYTNPPIDKKVWVE